MTNGLNTKGILRMMLKRARERSFYRMDKYIEGNFKMISLMEKDSLRILEASL